MDTPIPSGSLVVPSHGRGMIRHGGKKGDKPGPGRPKSVVRERLLEVVEEHGVDFVRGVLDGTTPASVFEKATVFDKAAKYSLGATKAITDDEIQARLTAQIQTMENDLPALIRKMQQGGQSVTVGKRAYPLETPEDVATALLALTEQHWR